MKIVLNKCYGGYNISDEAVIRLRELGCQEAIAYKMEKENDDLWGKDWNSLLDGDRTNKHLVQVVEELGSRANGACAQLEVVEIPDGVRWEISDYDGMETVAEPRTVWG